MLLFFLDAPYGRFVRPGWGPTLPARGAWILFESPAVLLFIAVYAQGRFALETVPLILCAAWQFHYVLRTFAYPLAMPAAGKRIPLVIVALDSAGEGNARDTRIGC